MSVRLKIEKPESKSKFYTPSQFIGVHFTKSNKPLQGMAFSIKLFLFKKFKLL